MQIIITDIRRCTMKGFFLLLGVGLLLVLSGCATKYIEILEPDTVWYGGESDFKVQPGDTLKVLLVKTCKGGSGTCYEVKDVKTGKIGYVSEKRMENRHRVYTEKK